jgi:hypothetical protein
MSVYANRSYSPKAVQVTLGGFTKILRSTNNNSVPFLIPLYLIKSVGDDDERRQSFDLYEQNKKRRGRCVM